MQKNCGIAGDTAAVLQFFSVLFIKQWYNLQNYDIIKTRAATFFDTCKIYDQENNYEKIENYLYHRTGKR